MSPSETEPRPVDPSRLRILTQEAVDATSMAYTEDAATDVDQRLRDEMAVRGIDGSRDDAWVADIAHGIRSGHRVVFEDPGSAGG